jgi:hypothetical protein
LFFLFKKNSSKTSKKNPKKNSKDFFVELKKTKYIKIFVFIFRPPFTASDPMKIYNIILRGIEQIEFPRHVTKTAITIIRKFCRENPTERLGYQKDGIYDIKKHRY